jgi:hydrogenase maturation protein HypF
MRDPKDRRYGHAFINCTDCGPRYTIISRVPYDRPNTTMAGFAMCPQCRQEYEDPATRRFHAQPVCCPACGPRLALLDGQGNRIETIDPIAACIERLQAGGIAAIKGIGGYHLACHADVDATVKLLRDRKGREEKPFAVMARNVESAERIVALSGEERRLLESIERPIVLCRIKSETEIRIAPAVAPGLPTLGVMLPYTPIHHLLFDRSDVELLIMTSANRSDEPMVHDEIVAQQTLLGIADIFLTHDRPILVRTDDSIARVAAGGPVLLRRGRGFVLEPLPAPGNVTGIIGCGGVLKSTVAMGRGTSCYVSQYVGNLENVETLDQLDAIKQHLLDVLGVGPALYVVDLHPESLSARIAEPGVPLLRVQHHHAHAVACMAENNVREKCVCVVYDGTGYGDDGTIWGGEIFVSDYKGYERFGHLSTMLMPGSDAAVHHPWRMAMGALYPALGDTVNELFPAISESDRVAVLDLLRNDVSCVRTSGMGRLFDSLSALLNICTYRSYEGQPAMMLEAVADPSETGTYELSVATDPSGRPMIDGPGLLLDAMDDLKRGSRVSKVAARFHGTVAVVTARIAAMAAQKAGNKSVCLSGGCFQNALLLERTIFSLREAGLTPLVHRLAPPNDESISYGQVVVGGMQGLK